MNADVSETPFPHLIHGTCRSHWTPPVQQALTGIVSEEVKEKPVKENFIGNATEVMKQSAWMAAEELPFTHRLIEAQGQH